MIKCMRSPFVIGGNDVPRDCNNKCGKERKIVMMLMQKNGTMIPSVYFLLRSLVILGIASGTHIQLSARMPEADRYKGIISSIFLFSL